MKSRPTVVITGSGTVTCQSVIKALRSQNELPVEIVTVDMVDDAAGRYFSDAFYRVPGAKDPNFVDALLEICRRHQAELLVPIVDYEFSPLSLAAGRFHESGCLVSVSPPDVINTVNNKLDTYRFFLEHGFPTAKTWDSESARRVADSLPYPVFLKPAIDGRSSIDCSRVRNATELHGCLDRLPNAMVQEFITGPEFTADVLVDWNGDVLGAVIRERLETKGGVSYKGRTVEDREMLRHVVRMAKLLGLKGPANIQAFRSPSGLRFNEINPRFSGALALTIAAGFNSPLMLLKLALGMSVESHLECGRPGVVMLRYWDEVFVGPDGRPEYPEYNLAPRSQSVAIA